MTPTTIAPTTAEARRLHEIAARGEALRLEREAAVADAFAVIEQLRPLVGAAVWADRQLYAVRGQLGDFTPHRDVRERIVNRLHGRLGDLRPHIPYVADPDSEGQRSGEIARQDRHPGSVTLQDTAPTTLSDLGTDAVNYATSIKARSLKRMAELVTEGQRSGEIARQDSGRREGVASPDTLPTTLSDLGITRQRLHEARKLETLSEKDIAAAADDDPRPTDRRDR